MSEEIALPCRPRQNPDAQYVIVPLKRGKTVLVAVTLAEAFRRSLDYDLQDSWSEIALGPYAMQADFLGFRQYLYGHVTGGRQQDDVGAFMMDVKERYTAWRDVMQEHQTALNIAVDICHGTKSLREIDRNLCRRKGTAQRMLIFGLKEYSRVNRMWVKYRR